MKAVYAKSMGHFDPLIERDVVRMVFIHTTFSFEVRGAEAHSRIKDSFLSFDLPKHSADIL